MDSVELMAGRMLKGVRWLKILRFMRMWKEFEQLVSKIVTQFQEVTTFFVLMLIFICMFSIMGENLFEGVVKID